MYILPTINYPRYSKTCSVDGVAYTFSFDWNAQGGFWTVSVALPDGSVLISGVRACLGIDLFSQYSLDNFPKGMFMLVRKDDTFEEPVMDNLGSDVLLMYLTEEDLAAI